MIGGFQHLLLDVAKRSGLATERELGGAVQQAVLQGQSVIGELIDQELVAGPAFLAALADSMGIDWDPEPEPDIEDSAELRELCPPGLALKHKILPLRFFEISAGKTEIVEEPDGTSDTEKNSDADEETSVENRGLLLATADPLDLLARQEVARQIHLPVRWCIVPRTSIQAALHAFYGVGGDALAELLGTETTEESGLFGGDTANVLDADDDEAAVIRFVNRVIKEGISQGATDIHLEPLENSLRIRYRVDGLLNEISVPENIKSLQDSVLARLKVMAKLDIAERRLPQDGRIHLLNGGEPMDVRVATIPSVEGESISLRLLSREKFTLNRLGLDPALKSTLERLIKAPDGIVLVTGPTGCGKSTTLYTFLSALNSEERRIVTIEDPVEHKLPGVVQIAVKPEIDLTFAVGLRSVLRGDPNVIMVGEIRDLETAQIAIRSALTGHMVFSTLHTNDAVGGITRLVDMGIEPFLVASSVRAFVAQRLVRKLCEHCKKPAHSLPASFGKGVEGGAGVFTAGSGCERCQGRGYRGRLAIYEVCEITNEMEEAITRGAPRAEIIELARANGFRTMREYGWGRVLAGETTIEEVASATSSTGGE